MVPPDGTELLSPLTLSPSPSGRGVAAALTCVCATSSVLSTPLVDLRVFHVETTSNCQSPLPQPLLCGVYPPSANFILPLSGYGPRSCCDPAGDSDPFSCQ